MLIVPSEFKGVREYHTRPPLGIGYIAEALYQCGVKYTVVDMGLDYDVDEVLRRIQLEKPQLICLTLMTFGYKFVYNLSSKIKEVHPDSKIFVGGSHVWGVRSKVLKDCSDIDFAIPGEGEEIIQELCTGTPLDQIRGLYFRENGDIKFVGDRNYFINYPEFPFPKYHNFELLKYASFRKEITLQSSRGCPYQCTYCASGAAFGNKLRPKSPKFFADEISYWYKHGYKRFFICDDNFTLDMDRVFGICDEIEKLSIKASFFVTGGLRADRLSRKLLFRLKEVGFDSIAIPVESASNKVLLNIKKGQTVEIVREAVKNACDAGLNVTLFFLIGSPGETWEDFLESIKLAQEFHVADVKFYSIMPLPGTELYDWLEKNNLFIREPEDFMNNMLNIDEMPAFETKDMSKEERLKARKLADDVRNKIIERNSRKNFVRRYIGNIKNRMIRMVQTKKMER